MMAQLVIRYFENISYAVLALFNKEHKMIK